MYTCTCIDMAYVTPSAPCNYYLHVHVYVVTASCVNTLAQNNKHMCCTKVLRLMHLHIDMFACVCVQQVYTHYLYPYLLEAIKSHKIYMIHVLACVSMDTLHLSISHACVDLNRDSDNTR